MAGPMKGKVAVVTGAAAGIGRVTAVAFARAAAMVVVADVGSGDDTVRLIKENGGEAIFVKTDVSKANEVEMLVHETVKSYGRLDYAFNNAGIEGAQGGTLVDGTEENWDRVMNINLKGVWLCMKYEIPQMLKQGGGAIVNNASLAGLTCKVGGSAYTASKHGVIGLTKTAALEYARFGIRVNAVCPAYIRTPMTERAIVGNPALEAELNAYHPIGRLGKPDEIAEAVIWLCSGAASFITGHSLPLDGGKAAQR